MLTQQTTEALDIASDSGPPRHSQELRSSATVKANGWLWFVLLLLIAGWIATRSGKARVR